MARRRAPPPAGRRQPRARAHRRLDVLVCAARADDEASLNIGAIDPGVRRIYRRLQREQEDLAQTCWFHTPSTRPSISTLGETQPASTTMLLGWLACVPRPMQIVAS